MGRARFISTHCKSEFSRSTDSTNVSCQPDRQRDRGLPAEVRLRGQPSVLDKRRMVSLFEESTRIEARVDRFVSSCRQRDGKNLTLSEDRYEGGTTELTSLLVKNASAIDIGKYACILENDFGSSNSPDAIDVNVLCKFV